MVYFDHNATTPLHPAVLEAMLPYLREYYGNASSRHEWGTTARRAIESAREQVAALVGVQPVQVIFTSGGTEANNGFIRGAAGNLLPSQILVSAIEHPCVREPARDLRRFGWSYRELAVDAQGVVKLDELQTAMQAPTGIVSVMLANNETGVIQSVAAVSEQARRGGALMHTDAVQAAGKIAVRFADLNVHAMTLSAHKLYGPKGVGALIVDKRLDLRPIQAGGGHERGLRSGTENVAAIVGFGVAAELALQKLQQRRDTATVLRDRIEAGLKAMGAEIHGEAAERLPNTTYFSFAGVEGETLVIELDRQGFAVASGAACSSHHPGPSRVLTAMGVERSAASQAVRISVGEGNTVEDIDAFLVALAATRQRLAGLQAIEAI